MKCQAWGRVDDFGYLHPTTTSNTSLAGSHLVQLYTFFPPTLRHVLFLFCLLTRRKCQFPILKRNIKKASCCYLISGVNKKADIVFKCNFMTSKPGREAETSVRIYVLLVFSIVMKRNNHMNNTYLGNIDQRLSYTATVASKYKETWIWKYKASFWKAFSGKGLRWWIQLISYSSSPYACSLNDLFSIFHLTLRSHQKIAEKAIKIMNIDFF